MSSTVYVLAVVALAVGLSACGSERVQDAASTAVADSEPMPMDMAMSMGDRAATPADEVAGAELSAGQFVPLPTAPDGSRPGGEATLARHGGGTTVTLHLEDLPPGTDFMAHVHEGACYEAGGPHYRHDPAGGDPPPNEIHLTLTSDEAGVGMMTVENPLVADERARSVVVHLAGSAAPKVACPDLDDVAP
jgi:Cu-Zn family superoxide dismutase